MKKILIVRFSSIGDIVLTTPVIRCLNTQLSDCKIHFLTKFEYRGVLQANPYVDKLITIRNSLNEVSHELKKENYDYLIDLHHNLRTFFLKRSLRVPSRSFRKLNIEKWLYVNAKWNLLPSIHIVDRYMETIAHLGVKNDGNGLDFFIPHKDKINIDDLPLTHRNKYHCYAIGGKYFTKRLPTNKIVSIIKKINQPFILLGDNSDKLAGETIQNELGDLIYNACGKYNLNQSASIIAKADSIISHDSGLMHIAAALRKKIISIWGNTTPMFGMSPYLPQNSNLSKIVENQDVHCRPCSKLGHERCPRGHFKCMNELVEEQITDNF